MRCEQFERRLQDLFDQRVAPAAEIAHGFDQRLARHAASCDHCRELLAGAERLTAALATHTAPQPSVEFAARVVAQSLVERRRGPSVRTIWPLLAAAAAVLVAVGVVVRMRNNAGDQPQLARVVPKNAQPASASSHRATPDSLPKVLDLPELGQREIRTIARGAGQQFATAVMHFPDYESTGGAGSARPEWIVQVTTGLRPLTGSVAGAFDLLRRTVPGLHDGNRL